MFGDVINSFLQSMDVGYGTRKREWISSEQNAVDDNKEYQVCANLKNTIEDIKPPQQSTQLHPAIPEATAIDNLSNLKLVLEENIG